ncbi:retron St85 family RNA-directed DNA polymerase [Dysgonomonas massiliensis]|uniref:retron St85 family RNA-directed DNA polymerase n=1 Tax=Dysgonomonas massiliensis TaxID=2040292 RepID=UPI000C76DD41|nr:retron St85 family RNA-directed DNA polymerase [Dysgonomonas massiliensis]
MNEQQNNIEIWYHEIDKANDLTSRQNSYAKKYVATLLKNNAVVIFDLYHLACLIGIKYHILLKMSHSSKHFYYDFTIKKRNGDDRVISAPFPSLKYTQKWIYQNILAKAPISPHAKGFVPNLSLLNNAEPHLHQNAILQMDIANFFPSISWKRVYNVFKNIGYNNRISAALTNLCCKHNSLPQGAPTSPILSNIILSKLDKRLSKLAEKHSLTYTRYADDITFSGYIIPNELINIISYIIEDEGFIVNNNKTRIARGNKKKIVTGISVNSEYLTIPRKKKREIRQAIYYIKTKGLSSHMENINNSDPIYIYRLLGYLNFWKFIEPENSYVIDSIRIIKSQL